MNSKQKLADSERYMN